MRFYHVADRSQAGSIRANGFSDQDHHGRRGITVSNLVWAEGYGAVPLDRLQQLGRHRLVFVFEVPEADVEPFAVTEAPPEHDDPGVPGNYETFSDESMSVITPSLQWCIPAAMANKHLVGELDPMGS